MSEFVPKTLEEIELEAIYQTLEYTKDDKKEAAKLLGVSLKTIYNKLRKARLLSPDDQD